MNSTPTTHLLNPKQLADEFKVSNVKVQEWLDVAGLVPEVSLPYGRGVMRLYDPVQSRRVVAQMVLKPKPITITRVNRPADDDQIAMLTEKLDRLESQNRVLYRLIAENLIPKVEALAKPATD